MGPGTLPPPMAWPLTERTGHRQRLGRGQEHLVGGHCVVDVEVRAPRTESRAWRASSMAVRRLTPGNHVLLARRVHAPPRTTKILLADPSQRFPCSSSSTDHAWRAVGLDLAVGEDQVQVVVRLGAPGSGSDGERAADRRHLHVDPVAEVRRALGERQRRAVHDELGAGVRPALVADGVATPRLTRWATHQSPAAARRGSLRSTTSSVIAIISLGSRPMSIPGDSRASGRAAPRAPRGERCARRRCASCRSTRHRG